MPFINQKDTTTSKYTKQPNQGEHTQHYSKTHNNWSCIFWGPDPGYPQTWLGFYVAGSVTFWCWNAVAWLEVQWYQHSRVSWFLTLGSSKYRPSPICAGWDSYLFESQVISYHSVIPISAQHRRWKLDPSSPFTITMQCLDAEILLWRDKATASSQLAYA